jgi:hypothetical protein
LAVIKVYKFSVSPSESRHICPEDKQLYLTFGIPAWFKGNGREWFGGKPLISQWRALEFKTCNHSTNKLLTDCLYTDFLIPVLSNTAVNALSNILTSNGELLKITYDAENGTDYFAYNTTSVIDVLDTGKSDYLSTSPKFIFLEDKLLEQDLWIFKISQIPYQRFSFVTDCFVKKVNDEQLTGFRFTEVWSNNAN